jgi:6-pyruvoyltetrahydropterin/6-carboxytetrahydropterin synthase
MIIKNVPTVAITRRVMFCASHRLHCNDLSDAQNKDLFGKCNNPNGHGHNYVLDVTVQGEVDAKTGMVMNLSELKKVINDAVMEKFDHKHLNLDVAEFKTLNPTSENVAVVIWRLLQPKLPSGLLHEVKLYETENNIAIYRGDK